jgi:hypothetical protein
MLWAELSINKKSSSIILTLNDFPSYLSLQELFKMKRSQVQRSTDEWLQLHNTRITRRNVMNTKVAERTDHEELERNVQDEDSESFLSLSLFSPLAD